MNEKEFLDSVSKTYKMEGSPYNQGKRSIAIGVFSEFIKPGGTALELGCADGYETSLISKLVSKLDVIDGSIQFIEDCMLKCPEANFVHDLFENYSSKQKYDYIFASYVLEHVADVSPVLNMIKSHLKPGGLFFTVVPNANSFSRQLAVNMGLIKDLKGLTENDINHGHRRVYDSLSLCRDLKDGGFTIIDRGGILFKLLADFQMDEMLNSKIITDQHLQGLFKMGVLYPSLCDSIYAICKII